MFMNLESLLRTGSASPQDLATLAPVRKVSGGGGNVTGCLPSLKLGRMVDYESLIEHNYIMLLEYDPEVVWYLEQPLTISYVCNGKRREYTPDFCVLRGEQFSLVECKPSDSVEEVENQTKFEAATAWCSEHECEFLLVTDDELNAGHRLANVRLLLQFARYPGDCQLEERMVSCLAGAGASLPVVDLLEKVAPDNPPSAMIPLLHMAFHHRVEIALDDGPISDESQVWLSYSS
jgi:hypothetical protein